MAPQYFRTGYTVVEAIQYGLAEYADNPWEIRSDEIPQWLIDAARDGKIVPEFRSEDYWYLRVVTPRGEEYVGPDDWIARDTSDALYAITSAEMAKNYRPDSTSEVS
ncbi:hypothetical protein ACWELB_21485 [Streptomyces asiaticus]